MDGVGTVLVRRRPHCDGGANLLVNKVLIGLASGCFGGDVSILGSREFAQRHVGCSARYGLSDKHIQHVNNAGGRSGVHLVGDSVLHRRDGLGLDCPLIEPSIGPLGQHQVQRPLSGLEVIPGPKL